MIRVISEGAPKWLISRAENSVTRRKIEPRTSRPNPIATLAPNHIAPAANTTCTNDTASMIAPTRQIVSRSPTSTPSSISRALRAGSSRVAVVCAAWRTTTKMMAHR